MVQRYQRPQRQAVGAVILAADGRVLLVERGHAPLAGTWSLPGGHVEQDETLEAAIVREVREETRLDVVVRAYLGVVRLASEGFLYDIHEFLCSVEGSSDASPGDDAADVSWADDGDLARLCVSREAVAVIRRAQAIQATP